MVNRGGDDSFLHFVAKGILSAAVLKPLKPVFKAVFASAYAQPVKNNVHHRFGVRAFKPYVPFVFNTLFAERAIVILQEVPFLESCECGEAFVQCKPSDEAALGDVQASPKVVKMQHLAAEITYVGCPQGVINKISGVFTIGFNHVGAVVVM